MKTNHTHKASRLSILAAAHSRLAKAEALAHRCAEKRTSLNQRKTAPVE